MEEVLCLSVRERMASVFIRNGRPVWLPTAGVNLFVLKEYLEILRSGKETGGRHRKNPEASQSRIVELVERIYISV